MNRREHVKIFMAVAIILCMLLSMTPAAMADTSGDGYLANMSNLKESEIISANRAMKNEEDAIIAYNEVISSFSLESKDGIYPAEYAGAYYEDGDPLNLPGYKYMEGRVSSKWMLGIGGNYYFPTRNERINLYAGGMVGFQMGRVETVTPYSGEMIKDNVTEDEGQTDGEQIDGDDNPYTTEQMEPIELYRPSNKAGTVWAIRGALVTGIEYSIMKGLILGFEVQPAAYNYTVLRIQPQGMASYNAAHHNIRVLACPSLKIGFRF